MGTKLKGAAQKKFEGKAVPLGRTVEIRDRILAGIKCVVNI